MYLPAELSRVSVGASLLRATVKGVHLASSYLAFSHAEPVVTKTAFLVGWNPFAFKNRKHVSTTAKKTKTKNKKNDPPTPLFYLPLSLPFFELTRAIAYSRVDVQSCFVQDASP